MNAAAVAAFWRPEELAAASLAPAGLTTRERQFSALIAVGLTSQDITRKLDIARRTAEAHTEHIMTKLGVHSPRRDRGVGRALPLVTARPGS